MLRGSKVRRAFEMGCTLAVFMIIAWVITATILGAEILDAPYGEVLLLGIPTGSLLGWAHAYGAFRTLGQNARTFGVFLGLYIAAFAVGVGLLDLGEWVPTAGAPLYLFVAYLLCGPSGTGTGPQHGGPDVR